jgi:hypothetical protein
MSMKYIPLNGLEALASSSSSSETDDKLIVSSAPRFLPTCADFGTPEVLGVGGY